MTKEAPEVSHVWVGGGGLSARLLQVIFFRAGVGGIPGARRPGANLIGPESPPGPPRGRESTKREPTQNAQPCRAGLDCQHHSPRPVATMVPFCGPDPGYGDYQLQPVAVPAASPTLLVELDQGRAKKTEPVQAPGPTHFGSGRRPNPRPRRVPMDTAKLRRSRRRLVRPTISVLVAFRPPVPRNARSFPHHGMAWFLYDERRRRNIVMPSSYRLALLPDQVDFLHPKPGNKQTKRGPSMGPNERDLHTTSLDPSQIPS